jgi:hypothetical protein
MISLRRSTRSRATLVVHHGAGQASSLRGRGQARILVHAGAMPEGILRIRVLGISPDIYVE